MHTNEDIYLSLKAVRRALEFARRKGFQGLTIGPLHVVEDALEFTCPRCDSSMGVGEYEAAGVCSDCYFDIVEDSK